MQGSVQSSHAQHMIHVWSYNCYICFFYVTFYICRGSYQPHNRSALRLTCVVGPIWSMTALHGALHTSWILHCPWLLYTEPCMSHGSYMIHKCSTRSLTRIMDPIWSMTALHGAYSWCYWVLSDSIAYVQYSIPGIWSYLNSISCFTSSTCLHKSYYSQISSRSGALLV
jgi:hypothetical protein